MMTQSMIDKLKSQMRKYEDAHRPPPGPNSAWLTLTCGCAPDLPLLTDSEYTQGMMILAFYEVLTTPIPKEGIV